MTRMIDPSKSRIPCWLIWALTTNGLTTLVGVTLTINRARSYKVIIERDAKVVRVTVEPSEANHLYNPDWDTAWQNAYGEKHIDQLVKDARGVEMRARRQVEVERDKALSNLRAAAKRITELEEQLAEEPEPLYEFTHDRNAGSAGVNRP